MGLQARLHRAMRIRTVHTYSTGRLGRLHVRVVSNRVNFHALRAANVRGAQVLHRHVNFTPLNGVIGRVRVHKQDTRRRRQLTIYRQLVGRLFRADRIRAVLVRRRTTTLTTTLLRHAHRVANRQAVVVRLPNEKRRHSARTLAIERSRVARQTSRQHVPRLGVEVVITSALAQVHDTTNRRRYLTVVFERQDRHRRLRPVRQRQQGVRPVQRRLQDRPAERTVHTVLRIVNGLRDRGLVYRHIRHLVQDSLTAVLFSRLGRIYLSFLHINARQR